MTILIAKEIIELIKNNVPPLVENFINLDDQIQPAGFDVTMKSVKRVAKRSSSILGFRVKFLPRNETVKFNRDGDIVIKPGRVYLIVYPNRHSR